MSLRSTATRWGAATLVLHWLMALMIVLLFGLGLWMTDLPTGMQKLKVYALHKSVGLTVLALVAVRLAWRALDGRPTLAAMAAWQTRLTVLGHVGLYALMLGVPLSGWLYNSSAGFPLRWFTFVNLPALMAHNDAVKPTIRELHELAAWTLIVLVVGHAAAAWKHHLIDRDRTLTAMAPWIKPRG